jgi:hypothetical protein
MQQAVDEDLKAVLKQFFYTSSESRSNYGFERTDPEAPVEKLMRVQKRNCRTHDRLAKKGFIFAFHKVCLPSHFGNF